MPDKPMQVLIEDADIFYLNFSGREGMYNTKGDRNFCVGLTEQLAKDMVKDGWTVKTTKPKEEDEEGRPYVKVKVNFKNRPPTVYLITSNSRTQLNEESVEVLDWAEIQYVDVIFTSYNWEYGGKTGINAYLKSLFVTINEDELERKYNIHETQPQATVEN